METQTATAGTNAVKVKAFVSAGQSRPITTQEFMEFWKACNPEERAQFGAEVDQLTK